MKLIKWLEDRSILLILYTDYLYVQMSDYWYAEQKAQINQAPEWQSRSTGEKIKVCSSRKALKLLSVDSPGNLDCLLNTWDVHYTAVHPAGMKEMLHWSCSNGDTLHEEEFNSCLLLDLTQTQGGNSLNAQGLLESRGLTQKNQLWNELIH